MSHFTHSSVWDINSLCWGRVWNLSQNPYGRWFNVKQHLRSSTNISFVEKLKVNAKFFTKQILCCLFYWIKNKLAVEGGEIRKMKRVREGREKHDEYKGEGNYQMGSWLTWALEQRSLANSRHFSVGLFPPCSWSHSRTLHLQSRIFQWLLLPNKKSRRRYLSQTTGPYQHSHPNTVHH